MDRFSDEGTLIPWWQSERTVRTGVGSRGGTYHLDRAAYDRAWRAAHPEYREREALRVARSRALARGDDPALVTGPTERAWPTPAVLCGCPCGCRATTPTVCGLCREGLHA